jgi:hypothetical protein
VIFDSKAHNHIAEQEECEKYNALSMIYKKASETNENSREIIINETKSLSSSSVSKLPHLNYINDVIIRKSNNVIGFSEAEYNDIPEMLKKHLMEINFFNMTAGFQILRGL